MILAFLSACSGTSGNTDEIADDAPASLDALSDVQLDVTAGRDTSEIATDAGPDGMQDGESDSADAANDTAAEVRDTASDAPGGTDVAEDVTELDVDVGPPCVVPTDQPDYCADEWWCYDARYLRVNRTACSMGIKPCAV